MLVGLTQAFCYLNIRNSYPKGNAGNKIAKQTHIEYALYRRGMPSPRSNRPIT